MMPTCVIQDPYQLGDWASVVWAKISPLKLTSGGPQREFVQFEHQLYYSYKQPFEFLYIHCLMPNQPAIPISISLLPQHASWFKKLQIKLILIISIP